MADTNSCTILVIQSRIFQGCNPRDSDILWGICQEAEGHLDLSHGCQQAMPQHFTASAAAAERSGSTQLGTGRRVGLSVSAVVSERLTRRQPDAHQHVSPASRGIESGRVDLSQCRDASGRLDDP
ncbi:hypothetical protein PCANC_04891 [Puccinia coronata f. sp. avenae]|uniref:Uncharacterized protein n=1 Tax=Puccinia coronata f. sp. avenae TaxID=200324 RepID=A0A2N5VWI2_9BASI|nr:hypothetical protein PCANC_18100 [Puccinia coronata f. sp. avenae]PLW54353.1 hypothetical protein PCANC_04891 [Puccinia coronata f. sp. avenae]